MTITPQYLAGFFDGEGNLGIMKWKGCESYTLRIQVTNTHLQTLQEIQEQYGGFINAHDAPSFSNRTNCYTLRWYAQKAKDILEVIQPYLILKKQRAKIALEFPVRNFREYRSSEMIAEQRRVFKKFKALNSDKTKMEIPIQYKNLAQQEHSEYLRKKQAAVELKKTHPEYTIQKIAKELKVSATMAHKYLRDSGISTKRDYWSRRPPKEESTSLQIPVTA